MGRKISTWDEMVGYGVVPTGDDAEENDTVLSFWGRSGRVWRCISLLETVWYTTALLISTGDGPVEYGAVDLYWGRCGRACHCRSLLGTVW